MAVVLDPKISEQLDFAEFLLRRGDALGVPSETVYGLAACFENELALGRVFRMKNRPHFDPLIVHVAKGFALDSLVKVDSVLHQKLRAAFWPGPLTLLFEKSERVPDLCTAGSRWVAIRSPNHPVFQALLERVGPLAAPSANRFGQISPTSALHVVEELGEYGLEAVLEGGPCQMGVESSVVKVHSENKVEVLRQGALSLEQLSSVLGSTVEVIVSPHGSGIDEKKVESPGQLKSHYAPRTPLRIVALEKLASENLKNKSLIICDGSLVPPSISLSTHTHFLSKNGSDIEAAAKLFRTMRETDREKQEEIVVVLGQERGLYRAIHERIRKAAH